MTGETITKRIASLATVLLVLLAVGVAGGQSGYDLYQRALVKERAVGDVEEALRLYQRVISEFGNNRALAAKAQYRIGLLHERLGRKALAQQAFKTIVSQYADQTVIARQAQAHIAVTPQNEKKPEKAILKQTGPSADGWYKTTFTCQSEQTYLRATVDSARHRLYVITWRVGVPRNDAERGWVERRGLHDFYGPSNLIVIDTETNAIVKTIPLSVYIGDIAFNPASSRLYATAQLNGHIKVIDTNTFVQSRIDVPGQPTSVAVNASTNKIYVNSQGFGGNDKLFVIDGVTSATAGPYDLDGVAGPLIVNSGTNRIYGARPDKGTRVFNGVDNSVVTDLADVSVFHVDPLHNLIYAAQAEELGGKNIQVIDGSTHRLVATFGFSSPVSAIATVPDINRLYASLGDKNQISIADTTAHTEIGRLRVAEQPQSLLVDPGTKCLYVCHHTSPSIIGVLDTRNLGEECPEEFSDGFNSPTLDSSWTVAAGQGSYSLAETPGHLRFRVARAVGSKPRTGLMRGFRGDHWTLEVKSSYFTGVSGGSRGLVFGVTFGTPPVAGSWGTTDPQTPINAVYIRRWRSDWDGCCPGDMSALVVESGKVAALRLLKAEPPDAHVWRIKRDGRLVSIERSDDGIAFSLVSSHTFGSHIDGVIQFFGIGYDSYANSDAYADFDYVRLMKTPGQF